VKRLFQWTDHRGNAPRDWTLGTLFHVGYGLGWGALVGLARHWSRMPALPLGALTGGLVNGAAFSSRGVGTLTATEPPPSVRGWRKQVSLIAVSGTFALTTALLENRMAHRG